MIKVKTKNFGSIEVEEEKVIKFKNQILGFDDYNKFTIIDSLDDEVFYWLQSIEEEELSFMMVNPFDFVDNYEIDLLDKELDLIDASEKSELYVYTLVVANKGKIRTNLKAPIVINQDNKKAGQFVLRKEYPTRYYLLGSEQEAENADSK